MPLNRQRGFSLLEMLAVVAIGFILAGMTFVAMLPILNRSHVDNAYETTMAVLRDTRHLAITQSHQYYVNFNPTGFPAGTMQVTYQPAAVGGVLPPVQQVNTYTLPTDISFAVVAGFPTTAPDGFGTGVTAIDFESTLTPGVPLPCQCVVFMPDGSAQTGVVGSSGAYVNGVLYMTQLGGNIYTSRALTVWGATGRIRGWRLTQVAGVPEWVQQ